MGEKLKSLLSKKQTGASLSGGHSLSLHPSPPSLSLTLLSPPLSFWVVQGRRDKTSWNWNLTFFRIPRAAGQSGVKRIFPISSGFAALQAILVRGLDSRLWISALQKVATGTEGTDFIETPAAQS